MIQRILANCLVVALVLPFCLLGISTVALVLAYLLDLGPDEKSTTFIALFLLFVPLGIYGFGMLGVALLTEVLRIAGLTEWFDRHYPKIPRPHYDRVLAWLRKHRKPQADRDGS